MISVIPVIQIIQKIIIGNIYDYGNLTIFVKVSKDGFLFFKGNKTINQWKIINDEDGNFLELKEMDVIPIKNNSSKDVCLLDDGKIFYQYKSYNDYGKFILVDYKK